MKEALWRLREEDAPAARGRDPIQVGVEKVLGRSGACVCFLFILFVYLSTIYVMLRCGWIVVWIDGLMMKNYKSTGEESHTHPSL